LASAEIDAVKGLFIVLVVAGHNTLLMHALPGSSAALYNFHVFAFLLLPFLIPSRPLTLAFAADRAARYLVPHASFYLLAALLYAATRLPEVSAAESLGRAAIGLVLGTPGAIERGCGLRMYWFLPALFSLALLRALLTSLPVAGGRALAASALAFHLAAGALGPDVEDFLPFGLGIALFMLPLGQAAAVLWRLRERLGRSGLAAVALGVWAATQLAVWEAGSFVRLAGLKLPSAGEPLRLALHDTLPLAAFLAACGLARGLARVPGLVWLGGQSLFIYLVHSLVFQALLAAHPPLRVQAAGWRGLALALGTLGATLALSALAARLVTASPSLRDLVSPHRAGEWLPLRLLARSRRPARRLPAPKTGT
jgi:fucose 4-O-acetylase-like acetyltransferase